MLATGVPIILCLAALWYRSRYTWYTWYCTKHLWFSWPQLHGLSTKSRLPEHNYAHQNKLHVSAKIPCHKCINFEWCPTNFCLTENCLAKLSADRSSSLKSGPGSRYVSHVIDPGLGAMSWYHGFYPLNALCSLSMKLIASLRQGRYIYLGLHRSGISSPLETFKGHPKANTRGNGGHDLWGLRVPPVLGLNSTFFFPGKTIFLSVWSPFQLPCVNKVHSTQTMFFFVTPAVNWRNPHTKKWFLSWENWTPEDGPWQWYGSLLCPYIDLQL